MSAVESNEAIESSSVSAGRSSPVFAGCPSAFTAGRFPVIAAGESLTSFGGKFAVGLAGDSNSLVASFASETLMAIGPTEQTAMSSAVELAGDSN